MPPDLLPLSFIVACGLALAAALYWLWRSVRLLLAPAGDVTIGSVVSAERTRLLDQKQALLLALKDLRAERDAGKLAEDDFGKLDADYRARARAVLRELDDQLAPHRAAARALLEAGAVDEEPAPSARACGACGLINDADALFCKKCGTRLAEGA